MYGVDGSTSLHMRDGSMYKHHIHREESKGAEKVAGQILDTYDVI